MRWLLLFMVVLLFACNQSKKERVTTLAALPPVLKGRANDSTQRVYEREVKEDSVLHQRLLPNILKYALKNKGHKYQEEYKPGTYTIVTKLLFGHLFAQGKNHLIVTSTSRHGEVYIDVYVLNNNAFLPVINIEDWEMTYTGYDIKDVNGDRFKDFLFQWQAVSGCCRRGACEVYLYQPQKGNFAKKVHFINPTFYASEKVIRGVTYDHPGNAALYKFRWKGLKVDTVEYIRPADTLGRKFYLAHSYDGLEEYGKRKVLYAIPKEYHQIEDLDWFTSYY